MAQQPVAGKLPVLQTVILVVSSRHALPMETITQIAAVLLYKHEIVSNSPAHLSIAATNSAVEVLPMPEKAVHLHARATHLSMVAAGPLAVADTAVQAAPARHAVPVHQQHAAVHAVAAVHEAVVAAVHEAVHEAVRVVAVVADNTTASCEDYKI